MTKVQFDNAVVMAQEGTYADVDDSVLFGCGLADFKPVTITLDVAAKFIAWHCINLDGTINCEELTEMRNISRKRWLVCS
jgi:hypothetical protein